MALDKSHAKLLLHVLQQTLHQNASSIILRLKIRLRLMLILLKLNTKAAKFGLMGARSAMLTMMLLLELVTQMHQHVALIQRHSVPFPFHLLYQQTKCHTNTKKNLF
jgi:hypothetical protein